MQSASVVLGTVSFDRKSAKMTSDVTSLDRLEAAIGHSFHNKNLLVCALTHSSAAADKSYERLEFLGDRVLGLTLAEYFYDNCPADDEGDLSLRLHAAARQSTLVEVAERLGIAPFVDAQAGMNVADNPSVMSDVVESLIAALYLDAGIDVAQRFITSHWSLDLGAITSNEKDAKSRLQEAVLKRGLALPRYTLVDKSGPDHAPEMRYKVEVDGFEAAEAKAGSRKIAEQRAAEQMLAKICDN